MKDSDYIKQVVIVGGGPVGNFVAAMIGYLGVKCTLYEKRDSFTREINLKIQKNLFSDACSTLNKISHLDRPFFDQLENTIKSKHGKILLKDLQTKLKDEALELGVKYIRKEIKTFEEVQDLHPEYPLILDCTGRNSPLRINKFGADQDNMTIYNLHHALHINFKACVPRNFNFKLLYPVIKNTDSLKMGDIVISKSKKVDDDKYSHITVPLFISNDLSDIIDKNYPNINRAPLKPFDFHQHNQIHKDVLDVIHSLFCALVMEDWDVKWESVVLKKINITCGFAEGRSQGMHICLGDSAAHFAYFKSLNFGLKHAYELVKILASYPNLAYKLGPFEEKAIVDRCWKKNLHTWPVKARPGPAACYYFITNSQLKVLTPYIYDIRNDKMSIIDILPHISQDKVEQKFQLYDKQLGQKGWDFYLNKFESIRKFDIDSEILSNRSKRAGVEIASYFIWLNGLSPIKISETVSLVTDGYFLNRNDFEYFSQTMEDLKQASSNSWQTLITTINKKSQTLLTTSKKISGQQQDFLTEIQELSSQNCNSNLTKTEICESILNHKISIKSNKNKEAYLLIKALQILAYVIIKENCKGGKMEEVQEGS